MSAADLTSNRVYIGNLPFRARWHELKDFLSQSGGVVHADIAKGPDDRSRVGILCYCCCYCGHGV